MGLFKKIFKPVRKVLDKIVPNEIKPFLPYAAAAVPFLAPTSGIMGTMVGRGLLSGGANIISQLAQEGADDDINWLSALMAGGTGALSAPGAGKTLRGMQGTYNVHQDPTFLQSLGDKGLGYLAKGADFLSAAPGSGGVGDILAPGGTELNMKNIIKAGSIPFIQGTGDAMAFEADLAMKEYEKALAAYNAEQGSFGTDEGRRAAILAAMKAYNHPEELIESTLAELGLRDGGRVGYAGGGIMSNQRGLVTQPGGYAGITDIFAEASFSKPDFGGIELAIGNVEEKNDLIASRQQDLFMMLEEAIMKGDDDKIFEIKSDWYKEFGIPMPMSENITEESVTQMAAQGGIMGYNNGGSVLPPGIEMDYRGGGFIPMGSQERADDVPARVSKNEFVMTADAVKAAGGGSVNKGAQRMYDLMNNLEARA